MDHSHELIYFPENSPIRVFVHRVGNVTLHWHQSIELLYVINGTVKIASNGQEKTFEKDGLFLINSNVPHSLYSDNCVMVGAQIRLDVVHYLPNEIKNAFFDCCDSSDNLDKKKFVGIKRYLAQLVKANVEGGEQPLLINLSLCYGLIHELYVNFEKTDYSIENNKQDKLKDLNLILSYINANYNEDLSLDTLASVINITTPYLSKLFKQYIGMTISDYIKDIRLYHASILLNSTNDGMNMICSKCGFPNQHAFISAFKTKYGTLPSKWRKVDKKDYISMKNPEKSIGYKVANSSILYNEISAFLNAYVTIDASTTKTLKSSRPLDTINVSENTVAKLRHSELGIIGVSRAKELLFEPIREQLRIVQKNIGFKYVKLHSIFDDDMMVYNEFNNVPHYNFNLVDEVYDFCLSINIKPLVELSFMPKDLAKNPNKKTFYADVITSMPKTIIKWNNLLTHFVNHLIARYGQQEVASWPFSVWNEPFTSENLFGFADKLEYFELFKNSYDTIKGICQQINVGGPSQFASYGKTNVLLLDFLKWCKINNCKPDFIDLHYYDVDMSKVFVDSDGIKTSSLLSPATGTFQQVISSLKITLSSNGFSEIPIYLTEWNSTTSHRDLLSDTCFKSSYIVKNVIDTLDEVSLASYWLLSDLHEESLLPDKTFHGGLGLFTINGIRKPAFFAYLFFSKLGDDLITKGDEYIVTKKGDDIIILMVNYSHYSHAYSKEVGINITYQDRYHVFPDCKIKTFSFDFETLNGQYILKQEYINRKHGSVFDSFVKMGAIEPLSNEDVNYLKQSTIPNYKKEIVTMPSTLSFSLQPFEIRLVKLSPYFCED